MNKWLGILLVSLALNTALAIAVFRQPHTPTPPQAVATAQPKPATPSPAPPAAPATRTPQTTFRWALLESNDFKKYIANLRAFGVSEKVIRDIILADVARMYRPKLAAVRGQKNSSDARFWEHPPGSESLFVQTRDQREQERALRQDQSDLVKALLGADAYDLAASDAGKPATIEMRLGFPPALRDQVREIRHRYRDAEDELDRASGNTSNDEFKDEDTQKLRRLMHAELAAILTPEQLNGYDLYYSDTAGNLRQGLGYFVPNEQEFRALFDHHEAMKALAPDDPASEDAPEGKAARQKLIDQKAKLDEALARALGANRMEEYKVLGDWTYRTLMDAGVPKDTVMRLPAIEIQAQAAAGAIRSNRDLSERQRADALTALQAETEKTLKALLNDSQYQRYQSQRGGWVSELAPRRPR